MGSGLHASKGSDEVHSEPRRRATWAGFHCPGPYLLGQGAHHGKWWAVFHSGSELGGVPSGSSPPPSHLFTRTLRVLPRASPPRFPWGLGSWVHSLDVGAGSPSSPVGARREEGFACGHLGGPAPQADPRGRRWWPGASSLVLTTPALFGFPIGRGFEIRV